MCELPALIALRDTGELIPTITNQLVFGQPEPRLAAQMITSGESANSGEALISANVLGRFTGLPALILTSGTFGLLAVD